MNINGRVNILENNTKNLFALQDKIPARQITGYRDALEGNLIDSNLSNAFFSKHNIEIIQNGIRAGVFKRSKGRYVIGNQSEDVLKIIMRSIFLSYSANLPTHITDQIKSLNSMVLNYCIKQVYGEATGYSRYLYDASTLVVPIDRPVLTKTTKTIEFKKWF